MTSLQGLPWLLQDHPEARVAFHEKEARFITGKGQYAELDGEHWSWSLMKHVIGINSSQPHERCTTFMVGLPTCFVLPLKHSLLYLFFDPPSHIKAHGQQHDSFGNLCQPAACCTVRFASTANVLAKPALQYYQISEGAASYYLCRTQLRFRHCHVSIHLLASSPRSLNCFAPEKAKVPAVIQKCQKLSD